MPKAYSKGYSLLVKHIRSRRMELHLSQDLVAARVGKSLLWVQRFESGKHRMDFLETVDLLRVLHIDLEEVEKLIQGGTR